MAELVEACPGCDTTDDIYERSGEGHAILGDPDDTYACYNCHITFDEPNRREPQFPGRRNTAASESLLERVRQTTALPESKTSDIPTGIK